MSERPGESGSRTGRSSGRRRGGADGPWPGERADHGRATRHSRLQGARASEPLRPRGHLFSEARSMERSGDARKGAEQQAQWRKAKTGRTATTALGTARLECSGTRRKPSA